MMDRRGAGQDSKMSAAVAGFADLPVPDRGAAARADPHAFRAIFDAHHTFVFRSLLHFGVPDASVDDAVQEVFVVVHRRLATFDATASMRAWLWGIARHVAANQRRSIARDRRLRDALASEREGAHDTSLDRARELRFVRDTLLSMD